VRTTVRLDPHLLAEAKKVAVATGRTLTAVIEDALRKALSSRRISRRRSNLKLPTFRGKGLQAGVELDNSAALLDVMENDLDSRPRR
jgi:predicted transcriptional regulator